MLVVIWKMDSEGGLVLSVSMEEKAGSSVSDLEMICIIKPVPPCARRVQLLIPWMLAPWHWRYRSKSSCSAPSRRRETRVPTRLIRKRSISDAPITIHSIGASSVPRDPNQWLSNVNESATPKLRRLQLERYSGEQWIDRDIQKIATRIDSYRDTTRC